MCGRWPTIARDDDLIPRPVKATVLPLLLLCSRRRLGPGAGARQRARALHAGRPSLPRGGLRQRAARPVRGPGGRRRCGPADPRHGRALGNLGRRPHLDLPPAAGPALVQRRDAGCTPGLVGQLPARLRADDRRAVRRTFRRHPERHAGAARRAASRRSWACRRRMAPPWCSLSRSADLPRLLTLPTAYPVYLPGITAHGAQHTRPGKMVVNGAYRLADWLPQAMITLERNPMFRESAPIERVRFHVTEDASSELKRFEAGGLHLTEMCRRSAAAAAAPALRRPAAHQSVSGRVLAGVQPRAAALRRQCRRRRCARRCRWRLIATS